MLASVPSFLLSSLLVATTAFAKPGFLTDIQLYDTFSGSNNCTDPHHWFLVQGQIFLPQNSTETIYFNVPDQFDSFPTSQFPLSYNSKVIGSITRDSSSNQFAIHPLNPNGQNNLTTTFNFLCKLSEKGLNNVRNPGPFTYTFNDNEGTTFTRTINYLAPNVSRINTNGGIFEGNNTAWFTIDIPASQFLQPIDIQSTPSSSNAYQFDTEKTTVEMVTKMDAFNQPLVSVPVTAYRDDSTDSQISIHFNSSFSGGNYVRITYYSTKLSSTSISNSLKVSYPSKNLSKRDLSSADLNINTNLYATPFDNLARVNVSTPEPEVSVPNNNTYTPSFTNNTLTNVTQSTDVVPTFDVVTSTQSAIISEYGVWVPVSTINNDIEFEAVVQPSSSVYNNSSYTNVTLTSTQFASTSTTNAPLLVSSSSSSTAISSSANLYVNSSAIVSSSSPVTSSAIVSSSSPVTSSAIVSSSSPVTSSAIISSTSIAQPAFINSTSVPTNYSSIESATVTNKKTTTETVCPTCSAVHKETAVSTYGVVSESSIPENVAEYEFMEAVSTISSSTILSPKPSNIVHVSKDVQTSSVPAKVSTIEDLQPVSTISSKVEPSTVKSENVYASLSKSTVSASVTTIGSLEPVSTIKSKAESSILIQQSSVVASTIPAKTSLYTSLQPYSSISTIATSRNATTNGIHYYQGSGHRLAVSMTAILFAVFFALI